jgi:hypothetical protein
LFKYRIKDQEKSQESIKTLNVCKGNNQSKIKGRKYVNYKYVKLDIKFSNGTEIVSDGNARVSNGPETVSNDTKKISNCP